MLKSFQELEVWRVSMQLAKLVYVATQELPKYEVYGLSGQLRRASVSVPTNIAEGYARQHRKEYLQFLSMAAGSQAELTTLILLAKDVYELTCTDNLLTKTAEVGRMLTRLRHSLNPEP